MFNLPKQDDQKTTEEENNTSQQQNNQENNEGENKNKGKKPNNFWYNLLAIIMIFVALSALYSIISENGFSKTEEITLSEVANYVEDDEVEKITVHGDKLDIKLDDGTELKSKKEPETALSDTLTNYGVTKGELRGTSIDIKSENSVGYWLLNILPIALPIIFIVIIFWFLSSQMKGGGMKAFSFGQSKAKVTDPSKQKIKFKDVAGNKEAKQELEEVVDFLSQPKKFLNIGAEIPKGVLLMGAPGTGKTLLARAVAGEAKVPFYHLSGSEFVEMFVGVGASRVRDLFDMAKKSAPAIIFIDELDAIGRARGFGSGGGNDEREQTLNQILVEMDGFDPHEKLIVMAATNRADVLDPALLRPGRFDRRVTLELPDRRDREAILKVHAVQKPLADDVNLRVVAERTPGFSGAELYSLMNEAAIIAAREDRKEIGQYDLVRAVEKVMIGPERQSHMHNEEERKITAYHEAGHAIAASVQPDADPVHKVSIVARGHAGGYTMRLPVEERKLSNKEQYFAELVWGLGGYVAELMKFGTVTTGPSNDLQMITRVARNMVTKWGMSDEVGPIALEENDDGTKSLFKQERVRHSEKTEAMVDNEVSQLLKNARETAEESLKQYESALDAVAKALLDVETLEQDEFNKILLAHGITPKERKESAKEDEEDGEGQDTEQHKEKEGNEEVKEKDDKKEKQNASGNKKKGKKKKK